MSRGQLVLFTGAGFSGGARARSGDSMPMSTELRDLLLGIAYPGEPVDSAATLGDAFAVALRADRRAVETLLATRLSVDPASLPDYYRLYFSMPWCRIYTLNVDDLDVAAANRFDLTRRLVPVSATGSEGTDPSTTAGGPILEVVHLNGMIGGSPERLTFSEQQYAERSVAHDSWYARCAADVRSRPVVYVGTTLHESALWHHIEMRRRQRVESEVLPPGSVLVTKGLSRARADLLAAFNVDWVDWTAEEFATQVLAVVGDDAAKGHVFLRSHDASTGRVGIPLVSELAAERPTLQTDYLLGAEPHWSDLLSGRAIARSSDADVMATASGILNGTTTRTALLVTGTAGSGKSTALMRLALEVSNSGVPVLWIDRDSTVSPGNVRKRLNEFDGPLLMAIDDADTFGYQLTVLLRDLVPSRERLLVAFAVRSGKVDHLLQPLARSKEVAITEHVIPNLTDADIDGLISVLDRNNRLGILKGAPDSQRRRAFSEKAGRQLLVAMIEATSGELFEEKAVHELNELEGLQQFLYAAISVATTHRHYLTKDEAILACSGLAGDPIDAVSRLVTRHLVVANPPDYQHKARHRVIAEVVSEQLKKQGQLAPVLKGLVTAIASKVELAGDRRGRLWRFLIRLVNHDYLHNAIGINDARLIYEAIESLLADDYHYWLQRGSLEVEHGDLRRAELFLNQSRSLAQDDYRVDTEYAYLLLRKAIDSPLDTRAVRWMDEGTQLLEGVIAARGEQDSYCFHVLGAQGLSWARRGPHSPEEKRRLLTYYMNVVQQGLKKHPLQRDLAQLHTDIKQDYLQTVVRKQ